MADILVTSPFQPFTLPTQFKAVFNGYIYCGTVDAVDPSVSQVQVYLVNESGDKVPVAQPLRTNAGGYLVYNGQPAKFVTDGNHSLLVQDSLHAQLWHEPNMANVDPAAIVDEIFEILASQGGADMIGTESGGTVQDELDKLNASDTALDSHAINDRARFIVSSDETNFIASFAGIVQTGQSLAEGGVGDDPVATTAPLNARCRTFMGGPIGLTSATITARPKVLHEYGGRPTIGSTLADHLQAVGVAPEMFFSGQAWGGKAYIDLKKGGSSGVYEKCIAQVTNAKSAIPAIKYIGVTIIHGEQDGVDNNTNYAANLNEWQTNFNTDIKAVTGQAENVKAFICQTSTAGGYGNNGGISQTNFPSPLQQLLAHETYPDIVLVGPKYQYSYFDHAHITNPAQAQHGLLYADAMQHTLRVGKWEPVRPNTIAVNSNKVVITFVGSRLSEQFPLVFDEVAVQAITNKGFSYSDGASRTITGVEITAYNEITLTLSGTAGSNPIVAYAYHNGAGGAGNQAAGLGDRGNVRTTHQLNGIYGPVYNWLVTFRKEV